MIPVLKPDIISCFLFCIISFPCYHLNIDTTCHAYAFQNTLKVRGERGKKKKSQTQIHLDMTLMKGRQRHAELSGIPNEFIYDWQ